MPRRLVRLGIIRLGHKEEKTRSDGSTYTRPVQDDHFVLTDAPEIAEVYGNEPRELDVVLPFADITRNFDAWYQVWAGGVLCCKGDGELVDYASPFNTESAKLRNGKTRTKVHRADGDTLVSGGVAARSFAWNGQSFQEGDHVPCPGEAGGLYPHCAACKKSGILKVMMADPQLIRLGYYQLASGSGRNYDTINGMLEWVRAEMIRIGAGDTVKCVRYHLRLVEEQTTYRDDNGMRKPTRRWFLHIEPWSEDLAAIYSKQRVIALEAPVPVPALVARNEEPADVTGFVILEDDAPPPFAEDGDNGAGPDWDGELVEENGDEPEQEPEAESAEPDEPEPEPQPAEQKATPDDLDALTLAELRAEWGKLWNRSVEVGARIQVVHGDQDADAFRQAIRAGQAVLRQAAGQEELPL